MRLRSGSPFFHLPTSALPPAPSCLGTVVALQLHQCQSHGFLCSQGSLPPRVRTSFCFQGITLHCAGGGWSGLNILGSGDDGQQHCFPCSITQGLYVRSRDEDNSLKVQQGSTPGHVHGGLPFTLASKKQLVVIARLYLYLKGWHR